MTDDRAEREIQEHQQRMTVEQIATSDHDCPGVHEPEASKPKQPFLKRRNIAEEFDYYLVCTYPDPPTPADSNPEHQDQYRQLRRTFFAGALFMLTSIAVTPDRYEELKSELLEFYARGEYLK